MHKVKAAHRSCRIHGDRKSTRLNSSHSQISYAVFCLKKKKNYPHSSLSATASPLLAPTQRHHSRAKSPRPAQCPCHMARSQQPQRTLTVLTYLTTTNN